MRSRRRKPESSDDGAYWMDTYGDMVTLLLTFFVMLFSFSTIDAAKWEELANSLSGRPIVAVQALSATQVSEPAIEGQKSDEKKEDPSTSEGHELGGNTAAMKERFDRLYEDVKNYVAQNDLEDKLNVEKQDERILIRMAESALFNSGSAVITPAAREMLPPIFAIVGEYKDLLKTVRVEGHTDNVPIQNANFEDNWMLSYARAHEVVLYLQSLVDIESAKLDPAGRGEYHPVATNDTAEGRARNRRVDFLLESILSEGENE